MPSSEAQSKALGETPTLPGVEPDLEAVPALPSVEPVLGGVPKPSVPKDHPYARRSWWPALPTEPAVEAVPRSRSGVCPHCATLVRHTARRGYRRRH